MIAPMISSLLAAIKWLPTIVWWLLWLAAAACYLRLNLRWKLLNIKVLAAAALCFRIAYAAVLSLVQYYLWSQSELTKYLISLPLSSEVPLPAFLRNNLSFLLDSRWGYFLFYSWGRFWLNAALSIAVAFIFYAFLKALKKYNERFFYEGETELGFLLALIVGWPEITLFVPVTFLSVIFISIFRLIYLKEAYTTLGSPMILSTFFLLAYGSKLVEIFKLAFLRV
jgi:hypothetical protein